MILGIGTDIVEIRRIKKNPEAIAKKILSDNELDIFNGYNENRRIEFLAGRFAAKEAVIKALKTEVNVRDIDISYNELKKPVVNLDYKLHLSISHEKEYAIAFCIYEDQI